MKLIMLCLALAVSCSKGKSHNRLIDQSPYPETLPTSPTEEVKPADVKPRDVQTTSDQPPKQEESNKSNLNFDFVADRFENYKYQVPKSFIEYASNNPDVTYQTARTYALPKEILPNSTDNGIYLTVGKAECKSRDEQLEIKRKKFENLGVPLTEGLVQGGKINGRSIAWSKGLNYLAAVFDREPSDGKCFTIEANVYGSGEWNQHISVVNVLQNIALTISRE